MQNEYEVCDMKFQRTEFTGLDGGKIVTYSEDTGSLTPFQVRISKEGMKFKGEMEGAVSSESDRCPQTSPENFSLAKRTSGPGSMRAAIATLGILGIFLARYQGDAYWPCWLVLAFFCLLGMGWNLRAPITGLHWLPLSLFIYVLGNALLVVTFKPGTMGPSIDIAQTALIKELAAHSAFEFFLLGFFFLTIHGRKRIEALEIGLLLAGLAHALSLIVDQLFLKRESGLETIGFLGNRSIGASFTAVWFYYALYIFFKRYKKNGSKIPRIDGFLVCPILGVGILAILVSSSGISYFALLLPIFLLSYNLGIRAYVFPALALAMGILAPLIKSNIYSQAPRYDAWPVFLGFWREHFSPWLGSGLGTFKFWGPASQIAAHFREGEWWLWAHNDWLQIYLELGAIGLTLALATWGFALWKTRTRFFLQASILSLGIVMAGNYPLHVAPFALLIWLIGYEVYG